MRTRTTIHITKNLYRYLLQSSIVLLFKILKLIYIIAFEIRFSTKFSILLFSYLQA